MTERFTVPQTNGPDLIFNGDCLAAVKSSPERTDPNYSGSTGEWAALRLYRTTGGNYVGVREVHSNWVGIESTSEVVWGNDIGVITRLFGFGRLAKELYERAGIDTAKRID